MRKQVRLAWLATLACALAIGAEAQSVYTAIPPCRIVDTRPSQGGTGAFAANESRTFHVVGSTNDFAGQGGTAGGCGIPGYAGSTPQVQAVMFNFVAVGAVGAGNLRAWATDQTEPGASTLNYARVTDQTTGLSFNIANGIVIPVSQDSTEGADLSVRANASSTDVVIDVVGFFSSSLPSGTTLRGTFGIEFAATGAGQRGISPISFPVRLATAPSAPTANIIVAGGASTTNCPGTSANPQAAPGHLCLYESFSTNVNFWCIARTGTGYTCGVADVYGSSLFIQASGAGQISSVGSWAVTAP